MQQPNPLPQLVKDLIDYYRYFEVWKQINRRLCKEIRRKVIYGGIGYVKFKFCDWTNKIYMFRTANWCCRNSYCTQGNYCVKTKIHNFKYESAPMSPNYYHQRLYP